MTNPISHNSYQQTPKQQHECVHSSRRSSRPTHAQI